MVVAHLSEKRTHNCNVLMHGSLEKEGLGEKNALPLLK